MNFKLIGFFDEEQRKVLCEAIRLGTRLEFKPEDVVITSMSHDPPKPIGELIRLYGFSDIPMGLAYFPERIDMDIIINSHVETLGGKLAPYVDVHAYTSQRIGEIVEYMKEKHLGYDVEQWVIPPGPSIPQEFKYPCVKVVLSGYKDSLSDVFSRLRKLGVERICTRIPDGFTSAKQMR